MIEEATNRALGMYREHGRQDERADVLLDLLSAQTLAGVDMRAMVDATDLEFKRALAWCRASRAKREQWRGPLPWFIPQMEVAA